MSLVNEKTNPLYDACVGFMVSERTGDDSWAKVATFVHDKIVAGATVNDIKVEFFTVEKQIKADFKVDSLPTAWRTAKSSALSAAKKGVDLVDATGKVHGKSGVEAAIKAMKGGAVGKSTDYYKALMGNLHAAVGLFIAMPPMTEGERDDALTVVKTLGDTIRGATIRA